MTEPVVPVDVAVVGAGLAGAVTALRLALAGRRVALVAAPRWRRDRGETMPATAARLVSAHCGLDVLEGLAVPVRTSSSSWGRPGLHRHETLCDPDGAPVHVDVTGLCTALVDRAAGLGVDVRCGRATLRSRDMLAVQSPGGATARVRTSILVDASGPAAAPARRLGARRELCGAAVAVCASWRLRASAPTETLVEAAPGGWFYTLVVGELLHLTYVTDHDLLPRPVPMGALLTTAPHTCARLTAVRERLAPPRVCTAAVTRLDRAAGPGWLAVGDAAAGYDPLSGDGLHHAVRGAGSAAVAVHHALQGAGHALTDYASTESSRHDDHLRTRREFYAAERRWPGHPFWERRRRDQPVGRAG